MRVFRAWRPAGYGSVGRSANSVVPNLIGNASLAGSPDANLWFVQPGAAALWTFPRLRQPVLVEGESARAAARRLDDHRVTGGTRGSDRVPEILLDIATCETK